MGAIITLSSLMAIAATVLSFIFIIPDKKRANLNKLGQFLHDILNFRFLIIEKILQALYILTTAYVIILGFFMLFYVEKGYYSSTWFGGYGILLMIFGPIAVRLTYEALMLGILLIKNVIQINNKMKSENEGETADIFATPSIPEKKTENIICPNCNQVVNPEDSFCNHCGFKVK